MCQEIGLFLFQCVQWVQMMHKVPFFIAGDVSGGWTTSLAGEQSAQQADSSAQTSDLDGNDSYLIRCSDSSLQVISIPTAQVTRV